MGQSMHARDLTLHPLRWSSIVTPRRVPAYVVVKFSQPLRPWQSLTRCTAQCDTAKVASTRLLCIGEYAKQVTGLPCIVNVCNNCHSVLRQVMHRDPIKIRRTQLRGRLSQHVCSRKAEASFLADSKCSNATLGELLLLAPSTP